MNESRATVAIVRRHIDRRFAIDWLAQAAIAGALAYVFAPSFDRAALYALGALAAATAVEPAHVSNLRRLTFFAVPLYGRQLARAHAIAPVVAALALPAGYALGASLRGVALSPGRLALATCAVVVATLVALSATFRDGGDRTLYVALAFGASALVVGIADTGGSHAALGALVCAAVISFGALRAFGETLARYDPLPERDAAP
ncbi:MAG: hypothetical protein NVS2B8_15850 [Vulcanimicrobiaceae bacterium]